jgi:glutathione S-transferase
LADGSHVPASAKHCAMYADFPAVGEWRDRMEALPTVQRFRAAQPPCGPIEHARKWAVSHRPKY